MEDSSLPEIFSRVRLCFDQDAMNSSSNPKIPPGTNVDVRRKQGNVVSGSFKDFNAAYLKFFSAGNCTRAEKSTEVHSVEVDETVLNYIKAKKSRKLRKIEEKYGVSAQVHKQQVVFTSQSGESILAQSAKEQFISLYQKTATGLQNRTYDITPELQSCLEIFPELLITIQKHNHTVTATGSFNSLESFETFLNKTAKTQSLHQTPSKTKRSSAVYKEPLTPTKKADQAEDEKCAICLETIEKLELEVLPKCKHSFCKGCVKRAFQLKPACPTCGEIYGTLTGTQPRGSMKALIELSSLPGYEKYDTILICYSIPGGHQEADHPNPGKPYHGVTRVAFLPNSTEGKKVLKLLERAFNQRLIFTIGHSSTTGMEDVVTWNDIHHKTSREGGPTSYGYPDPDYLRRVQDELKAKGIY